MKNRNKYNGSYIRLHGEKVGVHDGRIDVNFDQYRMKSGDSTKIYLVCNKIVSGTKKCHFSIRKDLSPK